MGTWWFSIVSKAAMWIILLIFSLAIILNIFKAKLNSKSLFSLSTLLFILCWGIFSYSVSNYKNVPAFLVDVQFFVLAIFFMILFSVIDYDYSTLKKYFLTFIGWSLAFFWLDILLVYLPGGTVFPNDLGVLRFSPGLGASAGAIYLYSALVPLFCFRWLRYNNFRLFVCFFLGALILATSTRIAVLAVFFSLLYYMHSKRYFGFNLLSFCFLALTIVAGYIFYQRLFFDGATGIDSINTNGRLILWAGLMKGILNSPFFGHGFGSANAYITSSGIGAGIGVQPHNDYLRIFFEFGFIGGSAFIVLLLFLWKKLGSSSITNNYPELSMASRMYMIGLFLFMLTDNVLVYHFYFYPALMLIFYCLVATRNKKCV